MVFDLDRQPLVLRIERRPARHCPRFEDAVELEAEIVMQPRCVMLLDHEPPLSRRRHLDVAGWLSGLLEIAFLSIGGKAVERHDRSCDSRATVFRNENPR